MQEFLSAPALGRAVGTRLLLPGILSGGRLALPMTFRWILLLGLFAELLAMPGCGLQIYNLGGSGHGKDFYVPAGAAMNSDPVVQSWIAYSLSRSTCQLGNSGASPSTDTSFHCELRSREVLVDRWIERSDSSVEDTYLDLLVRVRAAELLGDYVWVYLRERAWPTPDGLEIDRFEAWRSQNFPNRLWHRPQTRIIGYWTDFEPTKAPPSAGPRIREPSQPPRN